MITRQSAVRLNNQKADAHAWTAWSRTLPLRQSFPFRASPRFAYGSEVCVGTGSGMTAIRKWLTLPVVRLRSDCHFIYERASLRQRPGRRGGRIPMAIALPNSASGALGPRLAPA
jgi:hypothetical protein